MDAILRIDDHPPLPVGKWTYLHYEGCYVNGYPHTIEFNVRSTISKERRAEALAKIRQEFLCYEAVMSEV